MLFRRGLASTCLAIFVICASVAADDTNKSRNWPQWRGPDGNAVAPDAKPPTTWSETENLKWKVAIPGKGSASPIVWEDKVIVVSAIKTDRTAEDDQQAQELSQTEDLQPSLQQQGRQQGRRGTQGRSRGRGGMGGPTNIYEFVVLCLDRATGNLLWQTKVNEAVPHQASHPTNSYASGSPITDGKHIYAFFGSFGLYCLDMEGNVKWSRDFGKMQTSNSFGEGTSPTLHDDTLVVVWDHEDQSHIETIDAATGKTKWKKDRDEPTTWTTPLVVEDGGRTLIIVNGTNRARCYDFSNGDLIWECGGQSRNPIPTALYADGLVYCMSGYTHNAVYAIPIDAKGDITGSESVAWSSNDTGPYVSTGVLYKGNLYVTKSRIGALSVLNAKTGEIVFEEPRLPDITNFYASLVAADDKIYMVDRKGTTLVLKHGNELKVLATNKLDEGVDATPAIVDNQIFLRGAEHLYCFEELN